jgi:hypothetical protein
MRCSKALGKLFFFMFLVGSFSMLNACSPMMGSSNEGAAAPPLANLPELTSFVGEYRDIEIPVDMKYNHKKSMAVRTESFTGGVFYFSGKLQRDSLKNYIVSSMQKNKWKMAGEVATDSVLIAFTKPNKSCTVVIEEGLGGSFGSTYAAIYVAEDVKGGGAGGF